jgi:DNA-binding transcriptional MerR regulator
MHISRIINQRLLSPPDAAKYLGISLRKLGYLESGGHIKQTRLPDTKKRLYDIFDLDALIDNIKIDLKKN